MAKFMLNTKTSEWKSLFDTYKKGLLQKILPTMSQYVYLFDFPTFISALKTQIEEFESFVEDKTIFKAFEEIYEEVFGNRDFH